jgi:Ca2+-binding RTX toxin-like protein
MSRDWTIKHGRPDYDFLQAMEDALKTNNIISAGAHKIIVGGGGHKVIVTGTFFYSGDPGPSSGTVNTIKIFDHGTLVAKATGYNLDVGDVGNAFDDLINSHDFSGFLTLFFDSPGPRIVINGSDDRDVFKAPGGTPLTLRGNDGNDKFFGSSSGDKIFGDSGKDFLKGRDGADLIKGGLGNDTIIGGARNDHLFGGKGHDKFVFDTALGNGVGQAGVDTIADFHPGEDLIKLDKSVFTGIGGTLNAGEFHIGGHAHDSNDHIIYKASTGALFYDPDGVGGVGKIKFAELAHKPDLSHHDFIMI